MVDKQLVKYIDIQARKGYSIEAIRNFLVNYGYQQETVDEAINFLYNHPAPHLRFFLFVGIIFVVLASGIFFYLNPDSTNNNFSYSLEINTKTVNPSGNLEFSHDFKFDDDRKNSVAIKYKIEDRKTSKINDTWDEMINKQDSLPTTRKRTTKYLIGGDYKLTVDVEYENKHKQYFKSFKVDDLQTSPQKIPTDPIQTSQTFPGQNPDAAQDPYATASEDNPTSVETASCYDGIQNQDEKGVDCGGVCVIDCSYGTLPESGDNLFGEEQDDYDIYDNAVILAADTPSTAYENCKTIIDASLRNDCFSQIAQITNSSVYCNSIIDSKSKDSCLMYFVINYQQFEVCKGLEDNQFISTCKSLEDLHKIQNIQQQNKTDVQKGEEIFEALNLTIEESNATTEQEIEPVITALSFEFPSDSGARVSWNTNLEGDSTLYYGIDTKSLKTIFDPIKTKDHNITISELDKKTQYIFRARSVMNNKVKESDYFSFICCSENGE